MLVALGARTEFDRPLGLFGADLSSASARQTLYGRSTKALAFPNAPVPGARAVVLRFHWRDTSCAGGADPGACDVVLRADLLDEASYEAV